MEIVVCAFEVEGSPGMYNVWRYDTPTTENVLFLHRAESKDQAEKDSVKQITTAPCRR